MNTKLLKGKINMEEMKYTIPKYEIRNYLSTHLSTHLLNFKFYGTLLFIFSLQFSILAHSQTVEVFKCEKDGVTIYQSAKEGTDKNCSRFNVFVDAPIENIANRGGSSTNSSNSSVVRTSSSRNSFNDNGNISSISAHKQKFRDMKKFELLSAELSQEEETLKQLINKATQNIGEKELLKLNEQKTVTINNINSIKKELEKNPSWTPASSLAKQSVNNNLVVPVSQKIDIKSNASSIINSSATRGNNINSMDSSHIDLKSEKAPSNLKLSVSGSKIMGEQISTNTSFNKKNIDSSTTKDSLEMERKIENKIEDKVNPTVKIANIAATNNPIKAADSDDARSLMRKFLSLN